MKDCIFCKMIEGKIPCNKIYEDKKTLAFLDINPINKGHTLVIPKEHSKNILDVNQKDLDDVSETVRKLAPKIKKAVKADGINIMSSNGEAAGQAVPHLHIHIIPRFKDDGLEHWKGKSYEEGKAEKIAEDIKSLI
ncbi:HIT domain-containing protein [Candidatus Woesearchaeota archaeon]|nr:HIT domain-containing protein [Candidatus Woesearchaeota archaeon]